MDAGTVRDALVVGGSIAGYIGVGHAAEPAKARLSEWVERSRQTRDERSVSRHEARMAAVGRVVDRGVEL